MPLEHAKLRPNAFLKQIFAYKSHLKSIGDHRDIEKYLCIGEGVKKILPEKLLKCYIRKEKF